VTPRVWHTAYIVAIACLLALLQARERHPKPERFQEALLVHTKDYSTVRWLGVPTWQPVLDLWTLQETIAEVRPALLIECGTYEGGSSLFFAHLFDLMQHGRVITVDIEKQHDLSHPRITYLIGDCAGPKIVEQIRAEAARADGPVFVVLDSDHTADHVGKEMAAYASSVTPGSYLHVQDGIIDQVPSLSSQWGPGPLRAIEAFLAEHPEFEIDSARTARFLFTHHPKGWLRRRPPSGIAQEGADR
jgi:cephalosporin hydroxylase